MSSTVRWIGGIVTSTVRTGSRANTAQERLSSSWTICCTHKIDGVAAAIEAAAQGALSCLAAATSEITAYRDGYSQKHVRDGTTQGRRHFAPCSSRLMKLIKKILLPAMTFAPKRRSSIRHFRHPGYRR